MHTYVKKVKFVAYLTHAPTYT